jgi:hypothetical protein
LALVVTTILSLSPPLALRSEIVGIEHRDGGIRLIGMVC